MIRLLLWPIVLTLLLLGGIVWVAAPAPHQHKTYALPVHKTLYLERSIYNEEMFHIVEAAIEWNEATNGQVIFDIKRLPQSDIDPTNAVIILNVTPDYPKIIACDRFNYYATVGYTDIDPSLDSILLVDERITNKEYSAIVMHELGHELGLEHIRGIEGINTLMCPNITLGASHITNIDLHYFCKLYHCDESKFHGISEIQ